MRRRHRAMVRCPRSVHGRHAVVQIHGCLAASPVCRSTTKAAEAALLGRPTDRSHMRPGDGDGQTVQVELDMCYRLVRVPDDTHVALVCAAGYLDRGTYELSVMTRSGASASTSTSSTASTTATTGAHWRGDTRRREPFGHRRQRRGRAGLAATYQQQMARFAHEDAAIVDELGRVQEPSADHPRP